MRAYGLESAVIKVTRINMACTKKARNNIFCLSGGEICCMIKEALRYRMRDGYLKQELDKEEMR